MAVADDSLAGPAVCPKAEEPAKTRAAAIAAAKNLGIVEPLVTILARPILPDAT
jgi:hypothetical protein